MSHTQPPARPGMFKRWLARTGRPSPFAPDYRPPWWRDTVMLLILVMWAIEFLLFFGWRLAGGPFWDLLGPNDLRSAVLHAFGMIPLATIPIQGGDGQFWRLFTYQLLHAGLLHIAINMAGMSALGPRILLWMGGWRFLLFFFLTGAAGGLGHWAMSVFFPALLGLRIGTGAVLPLVGASGAIFGLLGALVRRQWNKLRRTPPANRPISPARYLHVIFRHVIVINLIFVIFPLMLSGEAHIAGFLCGFAIAPLFFGDGPSLRARARSYGHHQPPALLRPWQSLAEMTRRLCGMR